ncbi:fimbria A protein [Serratia marcescens]|uniref:Fimbria A protein n=1 Tax=Serratia marcescens TaxID=615 RepID=A0A1Q4P0B9_SERMA|nr:fimbrial protein [Serratia marcescens]OKB66578.1 fimbria A protein [Serratia marcescens]
MNMKKIALVMAVGAAMSVGVVNAADQGHGTVTFVGSIIDAPCSITPDTIDQTVNLGQISNKALVNSGKSNPRSFDIKLENCDVSALKEKTVTTTFTGTESTALPGYLAIKGTASGASIAITADDGKNIKLGDASPATKIQDGNNTLRFAAYLQGNGASSVVPGEFTSVANFTLAYQ